jgi:aerobic-type carbon monoxide dehydrogenase small subunit (CoxS/CutS family)
MSAMQGNSKNIVKLNVNGEDHEFMTYPYQTLSDALREDLNLIGTKHGCDMGDCGACTVLANGKPILSCISLASESQDVKITTIEGVAQSGALHPLQKQFDLCGATQCGYCSPGFILSGLELLEKNASPTRDEIKQALSGNICRCTGYKKIIEAVENAAADLRKEKSNLKGGGPSHG